MNRFAPLFIAAAMLCVLPTPAAELGSDAPALVIDQWVKGGPVTIAPGDKVYVVEFWATWCGPCRVSIPHLSEMQKKFKGKGVVFVGISDEDASDVKPFVEKMGDKMDYAVALDKSRQTNEKYMTAFNQNGIPTAFVIDKKAHIVWVGHPMDGLDLVVQDVLDGTYSVEKTKQRQAARAKMGESLKVLQDAINAADKKKLQAAAEDFLAKYPDEADPLNEIAWLLLTYDNKTLHDYPLALKLSKQAVEASKWKAPAVIDTYARALFETGDIKGAVEAQEKAMALASDVEKEQLKESLDRYKKALETK